MLLNVLALPSWVLNVGLHFGKKLLHIEISCVFCCHLRLFDCLLELVRKTQNLRRVYFLSVSFYAICLLDITFILIACSCTTWCLHISHCPTSKPTLPLPFLFKKKKMIGPWDTIMCLHGNEDAGSRLVGLGQLKRYPRNSDNFFLVLSLGQTAITVVLLIRGCTCPWPKWKPLIL